jgi:hypothetical protein
MAVLELCTDKVSTAATEAEFLLKQAALDKKMMSLAINRETGSTTSDSPSHSPFQSSEKTDGTIQMLDEHSSSSGHPSSDDNAMTDDPQPNLLPLKLPNSVVSSSSISSSSAMTDKTIEKDTSSTTPSLSSSTLPSLNLSTTPLLSSTTNYRVSSVRTSSSSANSSPYSAHRSLNRSTSSSPGPDLNLLDTNNQTGSPVTPARLLQRLRDKEREKEFEKQQYSISRAKKIGKNVFPRFFSFTPEHVTKDKDLKQYQPITQIKSQSSSSSLSSSTPSSRSTSSSSTSYSFNSLNSPSVLGDKFTDSANKHFRQYHAKVVDMLSNPTEVAKFGKFLENELASENLLFYQV